MSVIIIPRKHLTQPQGRLQINLDNPLLSGVVFALFADAPYAYFKGALIPLSVTGAKPVIVAGLRGWGFGSYGSGASDRISVAVDDFAQGAVSSFAFALFNSPASGRLWDGDSIYAQCGADAGRNTTSGLQYVNPPATVYGVPALTSVVLPPIGQHGRFHRNFAVNDSGGSAGTGSARTLSSFVIGNRAAGDRVLNGAMFAQVHWSIALSSDAIAEVHANPWQLVRADPIRIYSFPVGPISLTITSITASNITQTGARITLGLTR